MRGNTNSSAKAGVCATSMHSNEIVRLLARFRVVMCTSYQSSNSKSSKCLFNISVDLYDQPGSC